MPRRLTASIELIDNLLHPFHRITLVMGFVGSLSIQAAATSYFEPVSTVLFSFLLTFPLTTGLTIMFLILFNMNWKKVTLGHLVAGPAMFAILFLFLNLVSAHFRFPDLSKQYLRERTVADSIANPKKYQEAALKKRQEELEKYQALHRQQQVDRAKQDSAMVAFSSNAHPIDLSPPKLPWYDGVLSFFVRPSWMLYGEFRDFYKLYGPSRFFSGVVLAILFAGYIQHYSNHMKKRFEESQRALAGK